MADTKNNAAASRLGFLPKLLLWSLVLLFGYLYLGAAERYGPTEDDASTAIAAGDEMPQKSMSQQEIAQATSSPQETANQETANQQTSNQRTSNQRTSNQQTAETTPTEKVSIGAMPTHANRALADPSVRVAPPAATALDSSPEPASAPVSAPAQPPVVATEAMRPAPAPMMRPMPPQVQRSQMQPLQVQPPQQPTGAAAPAPATPASTTDVSEAEAQAFARAVMRDEQKLQPGSTDGDSRGDAAGKPARQPASAAASTAASQAAVPQTAPTTAAPESRGARPSAPAPFASTRNGSWDAASLRAEYEAMRRQAMEQARRRWEQTYRMRPQMPMPPYYGNPGVYQRPAAPATSFDGR